MKQTPTVGQILYSLNVGNAARRTEQKLTPVTVVKVGRKYFTCVPVGSESYRYLNTEYHLEDWREKSEFTPNSALYESEQEWLDKKERSRICKMLREVFSGEYSCRHISLDDLRSIESVARDGKP